MQVLLVRHGESVANREQRLQGQLDSPLSDTGEAQARQLGAWLRERGITWDASYCSPLLRARRTAEIVTEAVPGMPAPEPSADLAEVAAGSLTGLTREEILAEHPTFMARDITSLGDFSEFGGESYDAVQARVTRTFERLCERHLETGQTALVVAHGGFNFQLTKHVICLPVPKVCIVRWGNCSITRLDVRERRGVRMAELRWHVPLELMGAVSGEGSSGVFR